MRCEVLTPLVKSHITANLWRDSWAGSVHALPSDGSHRICLPAEPLNLGTATLGDSCMIDSDCAPISQMMIDRYSLKGKGVRCAESGRARWIGRSAATGKICLPLGVVENPQFYTPAVEQPPWNPSRSGCPAVILKLRAYSPMLLPRTRSKPYSRQLWLAYRCREALW